MKTAISIPTAIYEAAERLAARLGVSRSELYAKAVEQFLRQHDTDDLTARINKVCEKVDTSLDPAWQKLQGASLPPDAWQ